MSEPLPSAAELFRDHLGWIQGLARALVRDRHEAEDLAQETCVAALRSGPSDPSRVRAWLAGVMRNLRRERARGEGRRRTREERFARAESSGSTDELVERVALEREIAGLVLELDEPFRTTVLLRFFDELPPREIAERLAVPVATVHSRLTRGLARLRTRLEPPDQKGGRGSIERRLALLVPLAPPPLFAPPTPNLLLGALVMNTKLALSAALLVAVLFGAFIVLRSSREAAPEPVLAAASALERPVAPLESAPELPGRERVAAPAGQPSELARPSAESAAPAPAARTLRVEGRAFDAAGAPLAGLALALEEERARTVATSVAGGRFAFDTEREQGTLVPAATEAGRWVAVRVAAYRAGSNLEPTLVAARSIALAGEVVDENGAPLAGVSVSLRLPRGFEARFPASLEASETRGWRTRSGTDGGFRWTEAPAVAGAMLTVALDGYALLEIEEPLQTNDSLVFVLERPRTALAGSLQGVVVDPAGRPVAGARVAVGLASALSDADGRFAIDLARAVTALRIVAVKAGYMPAVLEREPEEMAKGSAWEQPVKLVLGGEPLSITGRVVGSDGEPRAGARVWLADPTRFGAIGRMPATLEGLASGALVPPQALESQARMPAQDGGDFWDETWPASAPSTALWTYARADGNGRFVLEGLAPRDYRLATMDEDTLQLHETEPIPAGAAGVEIVVPRVRLRSKLAGRVQTASGRGVPGVRVVLRAQPFGMRMRIFGGTTDVSFWQSGPPLTTDEEGRFAFEDVPRTPLFITFDSEEIVPAKIDLSPEEDGDDLTVVVDALCRFEVALREPIGRADGIALLDGAGRPLDLLLFSRGSTNAYTDVPLVEGRSGWVAASCEARRLVLLFEGEPVEEVDIELVPGESARFEP